jgi:hypothetical protein
MLCVLHRSAGGVCMKGVGGGGAGAATGGVAAGRDAAVCCMLYVLHMLGV